jgi:hypothetical protein
MLVPGNLDLHRHADLWYAYSTRHRQRYPAAKRAMRAAFQVLSTATGAPVAPGLSLAFEKPA